MKPHHRLLLALVPLFAMPSAAFAQASAVPSLISYQGTVFQADGVTPVGQGTPVNRSVVFRIWNHQSNSTLADLIYSETQVVTIADGQFSVLIGEGVATTVGNYGNETSKKLNELSAVFSGGDRYLGVTVAAGAALLATDNEISPRQRIVSTGFALRSKLAESIAGGTDFTINPSTVPAGSVASNYGLGWYGTGRLFGPNPANVDGPVLYGNSGGALGTSNGSGGNKNLSLLWNSSGQVGIGVLGSFAPNSKLTLQGDDGVTPASQLVVRGNSDNNKRVLLGYNTNTNNASLQSYSGASAASNLLLNPAGGNVGIGKTPLTALDVNGAIAATGNISTTGAISASGAISTTGNISTSAGLQVTQLLSFPTGLLAAPANGSNGGLGSRIVLWPGEPALTPYAFGMNGSTLWSSVPSTAAFRWYHGTTERMVSTLTGLGIGKSSPAHAIDVMGRIRLDSNAVGDAGLWLAETGFNRAFMGLYDANHVGFYGEGGAGWGMVMNRTTGNVGIGVLAPASRLEINPGANGDNWDIRLQNGPGNLTGAIRMSSANFLEVTNAAGTGSAITGTGFARLNSTGAWSTVSDRNLKCDIEPLSGMLDKAVALRPVSFHMKAKPEGERLIGFIAQEVKELVPSLVTNSEILTMDYAGMSTVAIGAIQEQQAIILAQQKKIEALEKQAAALSARLDEIPDGLLARLEALEAKEKARDNKLNAVRNAENPAAGAAAQTVSLKNEASPR
jgi:hypothetical protein